MNIDLQIDEWKCQGITVPQNENLTSRNWCTLHKLEHSIWFGFCGPAQFVPTTGTALMNPVYIGFCPVRAFDSWLTSKPLHLRELITITFFYSVVQLLWSQNAQSRRRMCCLKTLPWIVFLLLDPDYEEEKLKILAGERLPLPEFADLMPWGTEVYEKVWLYMNHNHLTHTPTFIPPR